MAPRVLLIDDEPLVARLYARALHDYGWQIEISENPWDALENIQNSAPDFVITDMNMPGMNAPELLQELNQSYLKTMPVLVLSAESPENFIPEALRAGADDFLPKGTKFSNIAARAAFWLDAGVTGLPLDARAQALELLPYKKYGDNIFLILSFPRSLSVERVYGTIIDQLPLDKEDHQDFNETQRVRLLGAVTGAFGVLAKSDPLSFLREVDLTYAVLKKLNIDPMSEQWRSEWRRLATLGTDGAFRDAYQRLAFMP